MTLDFSRCRNVWVPDESEVGGFWSPPPPHVKEAVKFIIDHPYCMNGTDMGGMKTASAIIATQFLHDADVIDRVIVITPASIRAAVWFDPDLGQLKEQIFEDKRNVVSEYHRRIKQWTYGPESARPLRWIISNYEYVRSEKNLATLFQYCGPKTMLILDESSAVRCHDSAQTEACMKLRWLTNKRGRPVLGAARCGRVLEMNGTPVAESPLDMFSQGNLLHPSILECRYVSHYKARYAVQAPVLGYGGKPIDNGYGQPVQKVDHWTNLDDLQRRFAPYVLRREAKDLGIDFALPPVGLEVVLTEETWRAYKSMRDELVVWLKSGVATAAQAGVKVIRLAQITSGFVGGVEDPNVDPIPVINDRDDFDRWMDRAVSNHVVEVGREKLDFALAWHAERLRRDPNMKLLVWCRFVPELQRYLAEVKRFGHPVGAACGEAVLGGKKREEREEALRLLHPKTAPPGAATVGATQGTGAVGLNFTACRTVLDMSYDASTFKKKQGDARTNRPGQTGPVSYFYLIAVGPKGQKTIDHHTMMARLGKANLNEWTVSAWASKLMEE